MRITALAGGVGGARFLRGLRHHLDARDDGPHEVTVIGNTGDDITLFGLRVCPDLDTILYTLGGGVHEAQGWGRADETHRVQEELLAYGAAPDWFALGDLDLATHVVRSQWLGQGRSLSEVTELLARRWGLPDQRVRLLPMTDTPVETHVVLAGDEPRAVHFQEWWVRLQAAAPVERFVVAGMDRAVAAPGVLDALREADVVLLPPSNPVVSIGIILGVPGVRDALRGTAAPVVGVSPLIGGRPVRGHADACLAAIGVEATSTAVAGLYADFLDGWLVDPADAGGSVQRVRVEAHSEPLLMSSVEAAGTIAGAALGLAESIRAAG
ncbi:MAG: 2-phospho-L-lactate transferase [Dermatophilaceae bacterium]